MSKEKNEGADVMSVADDFHPAAVEAEGASDSGTPLVQVVPGETQPPVRLPRLAIFVRHSLLDGRPSFYNSPAGSGMTHPFLGEAPFNVGDNFVSMALARALNVEEFLVLTHAAPPAVFEYVNEMCDALIVVSQNSCGPDSSESICRDRSLKTASRFR